MYTILITISIILSFVLVIAVLLQSSKGSGLAGTFGGAGGDFGQVFGTRRTADFLSKVTWWLGGLILGLAIVINLFFLPGKKSVDEIESIIQSSSRPNQVPSQPSLPPTFNEGSGTQDDAGAGTIPSSTGAGTTDDNSGTDGQ